MKHRFLGGTLALAIAAASGAPLYAAANEAVDNAVSVIAGQLIPNRYIVVLDDSKLDGSAVAEIAQQLADLHGATVDQVFEHALKGFTLGLPDIVAPLLALDPRVRYIEQDQVVGINGTQSNATWGLDRIDQSDLPLDSTYHYVGDGSAVHAYIIDTGIRTSHNEFSGRIGNGHNTVSDVYLFGGVDPDDVEDCQGHGTHVAGTVGGSTWGVAKDAILHPVRVLDCQGSGSNSGVIEGIEWVVANHQSPAVANMSLGGGNSDALDDAVRAAINAGVTMVVAAGNDDKDACSGSPNRVAEAITVGSTTSGDARSSFSNKGSCVDIFAPGSDITSAGISNDSSTATMSGTSMAAPHTAGVVALYLEANPGAAPSQAFTAVLDAGVQGKLSSIGTGSPNLLLQADVAPGDGVDNPPVASFSANCTDLTCQFDGSASSDDNGVASYSWDFGDGNGNSVAQTSHSYAAAGQYTVTLTVTDTAGQSNSSSQQVNVSEAGSGPCTDCTHESGQLSSGQTINGASFSSNGGLFEGWLEGPAGTDFDLVLQKQSCFITCSWSSAASSTSNGSSEHIQYNGGSGTYRWQVKSYSGAGSYDFWYSNP